MKQVLDLHIHSRYSRACSKDLTLPGIDAACRRKGIDIIATGDFTHPVWLRDIEEHLVEIEDSGLYQLRGSDGGVKFILSTELALIYKQGERVRRIHVVVLAPSVKAVQALVERFDERGINLKADGRPIIGMSAIALMELLREVDERFMLIPAHIWTPWFSVFGSKSGFDSMAECFGEYTPYVAGYETGLSSDPEMNWRVSALDSLVLLSNSDAHSLPNLAREANVFDMEHVSFDGVCSTIQRKGAGRILYTIEFYPEEGMYHLDGHRTCNVRFTPAETKRHKGICPVCGKKLTIGVEYRVEELADRAAGVRPKGAADFKKLVELDKIIAEALDIKSRASQKVQQEYRSLLRRSNATELAILTDLPLNELERVTLPEVVEGIRRVRAGELHIEPGFDGQYGVVKIFSAAEKATSKQARLL